MHAETKRAQGTAVREVSLPGLDQLERDQGKEANAVQGEAEVIICADGGEECGGRRNR